MTTSELKALLLFYGMLAVVTVVLWWVKGMNDKQAIACNYAEPTNIANKGAKAYFCYGWAGGGYERVNILVRSRSGRLVQKWEHIRRLENFRLKTLPPEHPRYNDERLWHWPSLEIVSDLHAAKARTQSCTQT
jgi:hypothetical protein